MEPMDSSSLESKNVREPSSDNDEEDYLEESILANFPRPRKIVRDWGIYKEMGPGVELSRDPWYFHTPVFSQLWKNMYLGIGEDGPKSIEKLTIPKQHLYYLSLLLHDALLKEDYVQAAYAMLPVSRNPQRLPEQIWRCGMEILKECSPRMMANTLKFQKLMSNLCPQYSSQMVLDTCFNLLRNTGDLFEAYQFLNNNINNKRVKYEPLFRAYLGMLEYALWKIDVSKSTTFECNFEEYEAEEVYFTEMHFYAKKAVENMKVVLNESGIWDVFVLKMVEILDYYKRPNEVVSLLETYRERNKDNPNAHRYLYWYLKRRNIDNETSFNVLKDLINIDVTSELAHEFIDELNKREMTCQVIELVFLRLDHSCCKNSIADWKLLYKQCKAYKRDKSSAEWSFLRKCLQERKSWWPKYHFANNVIKEVTGKVSSHREQDFELKKYKLKIARWLGKIGSDSSACEVLISTTDTESIQSRTGDTREPRNIKKRDRDRMKDVP